MADFYVYILKCCDGSYYTGHTDNIEKRLHEHYMGLMPCYTKKRRPLRLVFLQTFVARYDALVAEQQIKKWCRSKKEALIAQDWSLLSQLASRSIKKL